MSNPHPPFDPRFAHLPPPPGTSGAAQPGGPAPAGSHQPSPTTVPPPLRRRVEIDVRNLALVLGVLSLLAAGVHFLAVNWERFDASMRAALLVGVTVVAGCTAVLSRRRALTGTATAMSWLTMMLCWLDAAAVARALPEGYATDQVVAVEATVLLGVFLLLGLVLDGWAMRTGVMVAWLTAWWAAFTVWGFTGVDVWALPPVAVFAWAQARWARDNGHTDSWNHYGIALGFAAVPAVLTTLDDPGLVRPVVVITLAVTVLLVGAWRRESAAVWVGGVSFGVIAAAQLVDALRGIPGWAVFAIVGVALLVIGALAEQHLRADRTGHKRTDGDDTPPVPGIPTRS